MRNKLSSKVAGILACMMFVLCIGIIPVYAEEKLYCSLLQEQTNGLNIYYDRLPCFYLTIENKTQEAYRLTAKYEFKDENGAVVYTDTVNINAPKAMKIIKPYTPQMPLRYGIYSVRTTVSGFMGTMVYNDEFSIVAHSEKTDKRIGINQNFMGKRFSMNETEKHLPEAGIGWVREELKWSDVEKVTKNESTGVVSSTLTVPQVYDDMINRLNADGTKVLLTLNYGNSLYENGALPKTDDGIKAFANYCAFIAHHFKGRVEAFEIWNEPNVEQFAGRADVTGTEYAKLLASAYRAIDNVNKDAIVVGGSFNSMKNTETLEFFEEVMAYDGIEKCMDAISFHPYHSDGRYSDESESPFLEDLAKIKVILKNAGAENMPVWLTEFGSSSWYDSNDNIASAQGYTEEKQAANLVRMGVMAKSDSQIEKLFYYNIVDLKASSSKESKYGILDLNQNAKPAFLTVSFLNRLIGNLDFVESVNDKTGIFKASFSSYQFSGDNDVFVLWRNELNGMSGASEIKIKYDCPLGKKPYVTPDTWNYANIHVSEGAKVIFYDMYGNETSDSTIDCNPVYVVCSYVKPYSENMTITTKDGIITVSGCNANPNSNVTLVAQCDEDVEYIAQTTTNSAGEYSFRMAYDRLCFYDIKVYDSTAIKNTEYGECDYKSQITYYLNEQQVTKENLSNLKAGDKVKIVIAVSPNKTGVNLNNLLAIGAVYGENCELLYSKTDETNEVTSEETVLETEFEITKENAECIGVFLWSNDYTPLRNPVKIEIN